MKQCYLPYNEERVHTEAFAITVYRSFDYFVYKLKDDSTSVKAERSITGGDTRERAHIPGRKDFLGPISARFVR